MIALLLAVVTALIASECYDVCSWCACKLVRWSAFRKYADHDRAEARAEEWAAVVNDRPGKLLKLFTACGFACGAVLVASRRMVTREEKRVLAAALPAHGHSHSLPCSEVLARLHSYLDGEIEDQGYGQIREHLEECGPCLREYGLEEAVRRLVHKVTDPGGLRSKVLIRIEQIRAELEASPTDTPRTD